MSESAPNFNHEENMNTQRFNVERITPDFGLGFGEGSISAQEAQPEILALVRELINSPDILAPIDRDDAGNSIDDDGCGDGRGVLTVFSAERTYKRSLNRSKVFGGSATMAAAIKIGSGEAQGQPLNNVFRQSVETLVHHNIDFGAHTDEHAAGDKCGCGAIDRAPEIIYATVKYEQAIREVIAMLEVDQTDIDKVYANFRAYTETIARHPQYSGRKVSDVIIGQGKIVKLLGGPHKERGIVLNQIRDHTVNQQLIREATNDEAQIFAVDVWRLTDIADGLSDNDPARANNALLSELIYTIATAAVLTKGDLPVDMIQENRMSVAAV